MAVTIQPTKFTNFSLEGEDTYSTFGYRIYDEYGKEYENVNESLADVLQEVCPENILKLIQESHPSFMNSIIFDEGLYIGEDWFDIKDLK